MKNFLLDNINKPSKYGGLEGQVDFMRIIDEADSRKFRQESRVNSRIALILSFMSILISLAALIISIA